MTPNRVAVLGAGFSGLTLAWALKKKGLEVELFEAHAAPGGLIQTSFQKVMVEAAAHALLSSFEVEELFQDLKIEMVEAGYVSNSKWIFRGKPQKWPLTFKESLKALGIPKKPKPMETVLEWAKRNSSVTLNDFLVAPALQGVYGAQTDQLSASLVLGAMFDKSLKPKRGRVKGSVAPLNGMNELIHKLTSLFTIHYNSTHTVQSLKSLFPAVVVATGITDASQILALENPKLANALAQIPKVSLLSATLSFNQLTSRIKGFGCLFPKNEEFESLGVLFNSDIFPKRGKNSETWIFQGDYQYDSSQIILKKILKDRMRLVNEDIAVDFCEIHRWPKALPLYGLALEQLLSSEFDQSANVFSTGAKVSKGVYLTGNYLGGIGLAKILNYNHRLATRVAGELQ